MPTRPLTICRHAGCAAIVQGGGGGYCPKHTRPAQEATRAGFADLDRKKTPEARSFYASRKWTETSLRHREAEPLCRRCKERGIVKAAEMVHHSPPVEELQARGLSPYDDAYLESLCNACHLEELRKKRGR